MKKISKKVVVMAVVVLVVVAIAISGVVTKDVFCRPLPPQLF